MASATSIWNCFGARSTIQMFPSTKEILFARRTASSNSFEGYNFPVGYSSGQGGDCPTQDLVDAFECTDGKSISESPLYDANDPYANRDPRLAETIVVNGEAWPNDLAAYNSEYPTIETYVRRLSLSHG